MRARLVCLLGALALSLLSPAAAAAENIAGSFDLVDGTVTIIDAAKRERPAAKGDVVVEGDSVATAADAEAHLLMEDGGEIGLRQNTRIRIHRYKAEGAADDRSVIGLVQGAMRSVTGWIGRYNAKNYQIRTPTATVGVRGTDHETKVVLPGDPEAEAGTYEKVNAGATALTTGAGTAEVQANAAGFVSHAGRERPRLLAAVPAHFRPARNDRRFEGLHEAIFKRVEHVRAERIKLIRENRPAFEQQRRELRQQREQRFKEQLQRRRGEAAKRPALAGMGGDRGELRRQALDEKRQAREAKRREGHEKRPADEAPRHSAGERRHEKRALPDDDKHPRRRLRPQD